MKTREKTIAHKKTKHLRGGAQLTYTPSTKAFGEALDAELHYRGKVKTFHPATLQSIVGQIDAEKKRIDQDIERERFARWSETARAIIAENGTLKARTETAPAKSAKRKRG